MASNTQERSVDVAIIGAGTAGLAAYRAAVARTPRVVLIEGGPYGTTCARVGCMPSKLLIAASEVAHEARHADRFGLRADLTIDGRAVMARVKRERDRFVGFVVAGVDRIDAEHKLVGRARFVEPGLLDVAGTRVRARSIVIATGSSPWVPPLLERAGDRLVVNDHVFDWDTLPSSVAVFGTGVVGLELGQALHRLGVRVRLFGKGGAVGPLTDPVVREAALRALSAEVPIDPDARVVDVKRTDAGVAITYLDAEDARHDEVFEHVLAAAGRRPNLGGLGIENAGVPLEDSRPRFDRETLQCGDAPVFIAGDANHDVPLLHEAADEGKIAGENAARFPDVRPGWRRSALAIAFCDPQIAVVGERFADAMKRTRLVLGEVSFEDQGRSRVMGKNHGAARVYADAKTGVFVGAEMAGPRAENIGHLLAWAHQQRLTIDQMLAMPFYHPVVEEGIRTALRDASAKLAAQR